MKKYSFLFLLLLFSCDKNRIFDDYHDIQDAQWAIKDVQKFTFVIDDVSKKYNIYYNVRYLPEYPYHNLYVTYYLTDSKEKQLSFRLQELNLFDSKTGKPLGNGLGDLIDNQILSIPAYTFPEKGAYTFSVKQYMRQDPLPGIMSIGVKVEKAE